MIKNSFKKEKISIQAIGRQRFWFGIIAGIFSAISLALIFNYTREIFRLFTAISTDLIVLNENELLFYKLFFASLASALGLSISIWIWMTNRAHKRRKDSIYKQLSRTNAMLFFWIILMVFTRISSVVPVVLYNIRGYDNHLNLFKDYWLLFVLMPLVVFLHNWLTVRLVYKARKWIFISFVTFILFTYTLSITTNVNPEILNSAYYNRFEKDYQYIEKEIADAKSKYGIEFSSETIDVLKKWHTDSSSDQLVSIKTAFAKNSLVSMDTIILQKIVIRNFKEENTFHHPRNSFRNWHYALPIHVLKQIAFAKSDNNKTKELFKILREQIDLVNTPEIDWDKGQKFTETEIRRSRGAKYNIPTSVIYQLEAVRDSLIRMEYYYDSAMELPEIINKRIK